MLEKITNIKVTLMPCLEITIVLEASPTLSVLALIMSKETETLLWTDYFKY